MVRGSISIVKQKERGDVSKKSTETKKKLMGVVERKTGWVLGLPHYGRSCLIWVEMKNPGLKITGISRSLTY